MNKSRRSVILVSTILVAAVLFGGETGIVKKKVPVKPTVIPDTGKPTLNPRKVGDRVTFEATPMGSPSLRKVTPPVPSPDSVDGPHIALGRAATWVINNTVKRDGWSFTGWSKSGLDANYNPWRIHIGIVSGEMDVHTAYYLTEQEKHTPGYELLESWNRERSEGVRFGFSFSKRF